MPRTCFRSLKSFSARSTTFFDWLVHGTRRSLSHLTSSLLNNNHIFTSSLPQLSECYISGEHLNVRIRTKFIFGITSHSISLQPIRIMMVRVQPLVPTSRLLQAPSPVPHIAPQFAIVTFFRQSFRKKKNTNSFSANVLLKIPCRRKKKTNGS